MKKIVLLLFASVSLLLTGCLDMVEEITLDAKGGGSYKTTADMSGMFEMIEMMAAMDTSAGQGLKKLNEKNFDSSFNLSSFSDTASNLTAEQKKFFGKATGRMLMNAQDKKFVLSINFPFERPEEIKTLTEMTGGGRGLSLLGKTAAPALGDKGNDSDMPSFDIYDWTFTQGLLERKINETKLAAFRADNKFKNMDDSESMLEQMKLRTVIKLPAAAKKITGEKAQLSDDKKTVTINATLADLVKNPTAMAYRVEY